jgi:hypothetical protein
MKNEEKNSCRGERVKVALRTGKRSADFQVGCIAGFQARWSSVLGMPADWEIGGTAGWETRATLPQPFKPILNQFKPRIKNQTEIRPIQTKFFAAVPAALAFSQQRPRSSAALPWWPRCKPVKATEPLCQPSPAFPRKNYEP